MADHTDASGRGEVGDDVREREIVSARTFDAPRAEVFAAFVDAARLARWWGPAGFESTIHVLEPRPGGAWRLTLRGPDGAEYRSESRFSEVTAPGRIVYRHLSVEHPYTMEITLADERQGRATRVTWRMLHETADLCARVRPYVVAGNEQNFDRLAAELARTADATGP